MVMYSGVRRFRESVHDRISEYDFKYVYVNVNII